ncbi:putative arginine--tRNA ligase, mitochondrial [Armadillidium vulgare]|nr:putative arginine--tRNA ligase, mitochondrial [Armadillidium vulgare]
MAFIIRSFICNKIIQCANGYPIGGKGTRPAELLSFIKICPRRSPTIEYIFEFGDKKKNKCIQKNPLHMSSAPKIIEKFLPDEYVKSVFLDNHLKPPKIKFKVNNEKVVEEVINIVCERPNSFWKSSALLSSIPRQNIIVEYSSPNIAKPFHMGHLRSTIIGNFIGNLCSAVGHDVTRINYLGDWGKQFGLLKYAFDKRNMSEMDLELNPIKTLYELYVDVCREAEMSQDVHLKANEIFTLMEKGDENHLKDWKLFRDLSIKSFEKTFRRLNVNFDEYHGESMYKLEHSSLIIKNMEEKGLLKDLPDGRKVFIFNEKSPVVTVMKSDGSTLYITRDIAAAIDRFKKYKFDKMYYVVDNSQHDHFLSLKRILKALGHDWSDNIEYVNFGRIMGMSTRKGQVVFLDDVLNEAKELTLVKQKESANTYFDIDSEMSHNVADVVGASSIIFGDLKRRRTKDYNFSWNDMLKETGDTGARLQYSHCRLVRLEENCGLPYNHNANLKSLLEPEAIDLVRLIARFDEILYESLEELESSKLALYLIDLSNAINRAYKTLPVKSEKVPVGEDRLKLYRASRLTLAAGMKILGMSPLNYM